MTLGPVDRLIGRASRLWFRGQTAAAQQERLDWARRSLRPTGV